MKQLLIILSALFIAGCCSTELATITEIDTIAIRDTAKLADLDSVWVGPIRVNDDSVGSLAVYPVSKTAVVNIKWLKPDTIFYEVPTTYPVILDGFLNRLLETFFRVMPFWQKLILILMVIAGFYIYYLIKRKAPGA